MQHFGDWGNNHKQTEGIFQVETKMKEAGKVLLPLIIILVKQYFYFIHF